MNVFEDLIVELKQENLLEKTVIDDTLDTRHLEETAVPNADMPLLELNSDPIEAETPYSTNGADEYDAHLHETAVPEAADVAPTPVKPRNGQEFYRKRAMAEVSNLQMVEHVLTGVEREYMKMLPRVYDDFEAKKALNAFVQVTDGENSAMHQEAEFRLMTETEAWCSALAERDKGISVTSLRQYCENSRPPLSSQALVALGRFYRNLPYSEQVRSKFDFVITRLFSRATEGELRTMVFSPAETLTHIHTLYRDWSSIALYGASGDDADNTLAALSFEDLAAEAESASSFDELIGKGFFERVRTFKDAIGELFFAPNVLTAAINANLRIGNAYVKLIDQERERLVEDKVAAKYGEKYDDLISEGIGRTIELIDLLKGPSNSERPVFSDDFEEEAADVPETAPTRPERRPLPEKSASKKGEASPSNRPAFVDSIIASALSVNRWLLIVSAALIVGSVGIYVYANFFATEAAKDPGVRELAIDDPVYRDYLTSGRVTDQMFYGITNQSWNGLPKERKQEILTKIYQSGKANGYTQVNLLSEDGKPAAYASATRLDVLN